VGRGSLRGGQGGGRGGVGGDRVDLVLVSGGLREAAMEADILNEELERGPSDHVPLFVGLDLGRLGGGEAWGKGGWEWVKGC